MVYTNLATTDMSIPKEIAKVYFEKFLEEKEKKEKNLKNRIKLYLNK